MFVGKVKGSLWATRKDEKLNGLKFLVVERQLDDHQTDPALVIAAVGHYRKFSSCEFE